MVKGNEASGTGTVFRAMTPDDDGQPQVDASARTLGSRPSIDVPGDGTDDVDPGTGGMSVSIGAAHHLPAHRRPVEFGGSGADPIFVIEASELGPDLRVRTDDDGPSGHGFVEPVRRMEFNDYQQAIWASRPRWQRVDP